MLANSIFNYSITQQNFDVDTNEAFLDEVKDYKVDWDNLGVDKDGNWKIFDGKGYGTKSSQNNTLREAVGDDPDKIVQFLVDRLKADTSLSADQKQRYMQTIIGNYRRLGNSAPIKVTNLGKDSNGNTIQYKWDESAGSGTVSTDSTTTTNTTTDTAGNTNVNGTNTPQQQAELANQAKIRGDAALQQLLGRFIDTGFGVTKDANGAITELKGAGNNDDNMKLYNALTPEQKEQFNKVLESRGNADNKWYKRAFAFGNKDEKDRITAIENVNRDWLTNTGVRTTNQWTADAIQNVGYNNVAANASRTSIDSVGNKQTQTQTSQAKPTIASGNDWGTKDDVAKLVNNYRGTGGWYANAQASGDAEIKRRADLAREMLNGNRAYVGTTDKGIQNLGSQNQKIIDEYNNWKNTRSQPIQVNNATTNKDKAPVNNTNMEK